MSRADRSTAGGRRLESPSSAPPPVSATGGARLRRREVAPAGRISALRSGSGRGTASALLHSADASAGSGGRAGFALRGVSTARGSAGVRGASGGRGVSVARGGPGRRGARVAPGVSVAGELLGTQQGSAVHGGVAARGGSTGRGTSGRRGGAGPVGVAGGRAVSRGSRVAAGPQAAAARDGQRRPAPAAPQAVALRPAARADGRAVWRWRNDEATRRASFGSARIAYRDHARWFRDSLARPDRRIHIVLADGRPCGVVRLDVLGSTATVSIFLERRHQGRGIGPRALDALASVARRQPGVRRLLALIRPDNAPSLAAFARAGFRVSRRARAVTMTRRLAPADSARGAAARRVASGAR